MIDETKDIHADYANAILGGDPVVRARTETTELASASDTRDGMRKQGPAFYGLFSSYTGGRYFLLTVSTEEAARVLVANREELIPDMPYYTQIRWIFAMKFARFACGKYNPQNEVYTSYAHRLVRKALELMPEPFDAELRGLSHGKLLLLGGGTGVKGPTSKMRGYTILHNAILRSGWDDKWLTDTKHLVVSPIWLQRQSQIVKNMFTEFYKNAMIELVPSVIGDDAVTNLELANANTPEQLLEAIVTYPYTPITIKSDDVALIGQIEARRKVQFTVNERIEIMLAYNLTVTRLSDPKRKGYTENCPKAKILDHMRRYLSDSVDVRFRAQSVTTMGRMIGITTPIDFAYHKINDALVSSGFFRVLAVLGTANGNAWESKQLPEFIAVISRYLGLTTPTAQRLRYEQLTASPVEKPVAIAVSLTGAAEPKVTSFVPVEEAPVEPTTPEPKHGGNTLLWVVSVLAVATIIFGYLAANHVDVGAALSQLVGK